MTDDNLDAEFALIDCRSGLIGGRDAELENCHPRENGADQQERNQDDHQVQEGRNVQLRRFIMPSAKPSPDHGYPAEN